MEFAAELQASLREFTASGIVEVRENGGCVAPFSGMSWEVRGDGEKPLLHLWSEQLNLTRRVLAIIDHSEQRLALAGRVKRGTLRTTDLGQPELRLLHPAGGGEERQIAPRPGAVARFFAGRRS